MRYFPLLLLLFSPIILYAEQTEYGECIYLPEKSEGYPYPEMTSSKDCGKIDANGTFIIKKGTSEKLPPIEQILKQGVTAH